MADTNLSKSLSSIVNSLSGLYDANVAVTNTAEAISSAIGAGFSSTNTVSGFVASSVATAKSAIEEVIGTNSDATISSTTLWNAIKEVQDEADAKVVAQGVARTNADDAISAAIGEGFNSTDTVKAAIEAIQTAAISVSGAANNAVEVTSEGVNKTVGLKINANDKFLSQTSDGLSATFSLKKVTTGLGDTVAAEYYIEDKNGQQVGDRISIAKDKFLKSADFVQGTGSGDDKLQLTFNTADGTEDVVDIPLSGLFDEYTAGAGIALTPTSTGIEISGVVDAASEAFLTVGANGFKLSGVNTAIETAVDAEEQRATGVENAIRTDLDALSTNFDTKLAGVTSTVTGLIDAEESARIAADNSITGLIQTGFNITGEVTAESVATNSVSAQINAYDASLADVLADLEAIKAKVESL